ncbi:MAG: hypothetical protein R3F59_30490 [Myxococcota bacterium]
MAAGRRRHPGGGGAARADPPHRRRAGPRRRLPTLLPALRSAGVTDAVVSSDGDAITVLAVGGDPLAALAIVPNVAVTGFDGAWTVSPAARARHGGRRRDRRGGGAAGGLGGAVRVVVHGRRARGSTMTRSPRGAGVSRRAVADALRAATVGVAVRDRLRVVTTGAGLRPTDLGQVLVTGSDGRVVPLADAARLTLGLDRDLLRLDGQQAAEVVVRTEDADALRRLVASVPLPPGVTASVRPPGRERPR